MEQEKDNEQASWDDVRSELQDLIKTQKSADEERKEALSHLIDDLEKTRRELEEIDKDP